MCEETDINFEERFGFEKGWESDFSKLKRLEKSLFTNTVFYALQRKLGGVAAQIFQALWPLYLPPDIDAEKLCKISKDFSRKYGNFKNKRSNAIKSKATMTNFVGDTCFVPEFFAKYESVTEFSNTSNVFTAVPVNPAEESVAEDVPMASTSSSPSKKCLKQKNRELRQELSVVHDELTLYKRKSSSQIAVSAKKAKVAARAQAAQGENVISNDLHTFSSGQLFQASLNGSKGKFSFARFSSENLNSGIGPRQLDNRASFAFLLLYLISGCPFDDVIAGKNFDNAIEPLLKHMIKRKKNIFTHALESAGLHLLTPLTVVQAVNLKSLM